MDHLLNACHRHSRVQVLKVHATGALKQRLLSFGLMRGAIVEILECSLVKSTMEIRVGSVTLALRAEEAQLIEVTHVD